MAKNSMFFCDFCKASLQKDAENTRFFAFFHKILGKKGQKHEVFRIFWSKCAGKMKSRTRAQPPQKNQTVISDSVISVPTGDCLGRQPVLADPKP